MAQQSFLQRQQRRYGTGQPPMAGGGATPYASYQQAPPQAQGPSSQPATPRVDRVGGGGQQGAAPPAQQQTQNWGATTAAAGGATPYPGQAGATASPQPAPSPTSRGRYQQWRRETANGRPDGAFNTFTGGNGVDAASASAPNTGGAGPDRSPVTPPSAPAPARWSGVNPESVWTPQTAQQELERHLGRALTPEEQQEAAQLIGYGGSGEITGTQLNQLIQEAARRSGNPYTDYTPPQAPTPPTPPQPGEVGHQGRVAVEPPTSRPDYGNADPALRALIDRILANPESLSPQVVEQMKAAAKEQALAMGEQLRAESDAGLANRGFSGVGGVQRSATDAVNASLADSILAANRDLDIQAATTNFADRMAAAGLGNSYLNDVTARWGAQDAADFRNAQFRSDQMNQDRSSTLQEWLAQQGVDLDNRRFAEANRQFTQTFGLDIGRFLEGIRQFNLNLTEQQRQHNNNLGLGYNNLNLQGQNGLMAWLQSIVNGGR